MRRSPCDQLENLEAAGERQRVRDRPVCCVGKCRQRGGARVLDQFAPRQRSVRNAGDGRVAERSRDGGERFARSQASRRVGRSLPGLVLSSRRFAAHPELAHVQARRLSEPLGVFGVECAQLVVARLPEIGGIGHRGEQHGHELASNHAVALRQSELESALDQQLLVDQPLENEASLAVAHGIAPIAGERRERALVVRRPQRRAVDQGDGALGQACAGALPRFRAGQQRACRRGKPDERSDREPRDCTRCGCPPKFPTPHGRTSRCGGSIQAALRGGRGTIRVVARRPHEGVQMQLRALAIVAVLGAFACGGPNEEAPAPETSVPEVVALPERFPSELAALRPLVGQYPRDSDLWNREPLAARLQALLGPRLPDFLRNMEVQGPLLEEQGLLYATGNKQHSGGSDAAALVADLRRDVLWLWLLVDGSASVFIDRDVEVELPADVRIVLENADMDLTGIDDPEDGELEPSIEP